MNRLKLEIDIPQEVYERLGAFIHKTVEDAFSQKVNALGKQKVKLTRKEAAKTLRISLVTLDKLRTDGVLIAQTIGKRVLFDQLAIEEYLNRKSESLRARQA